MEIAEQGADVIGLSEHCIATSDIDITVAKLKDQTWSSHWRTGRVDAAGRTTGGVAILLRAGLEFVPTSHPLLDEFESLGRVMTGWVLRGGKPCFHAMVLYCVADPHTVQNSDFAQRMLKALEDWHSIHRGQKVCVFGDLNMTMDEDPKLASWTSTGRYTDLLENFKTDEHREATHVAGRALDHLLVSAPMDHAITYATVDPIWRFPSHRAVMCRLSLNRLFGHEQSAGVSLRVPQVMPISKLIKNHLSTHDDDVGKEDLNRALAAADVNASLAAWSWRWERKTLMAAEATGTQTSLLMEGRGLPETYDDDEPTPQPHAAPRFAHRPIEVRQLRRSTSLTRTWLQQSTRDISWSDAADFDRKEVYILKRLRKLHGLDHAFISQTTVAKLTELLNEKVKQHDQQRIAAWRSDMMQIGAACKYVRGAVAQRTSVITSTDGSLAVGYEQMDACLKDFWMQVAHPKQTTLAAWPTVPEAPMVPFSAEILAKLISKTRKHTAPGPGSWRAKELAQLPTLALTELAEIMNLVLSTGETPRIWRTSWTSFLKKGATSRVDSLRPITVTALTWRLFSKHIYNTVGPAVDSCLHPAQCGARPGHSSVTAALSAKRFSDLCSHDKCAGFALQLDLVKCFNSLSASDGVYLLGRMGCPSSVCQLLQLHYGAMATRNKLSSVWAGSEYKTVRGCPQGCPLSTLLANASLKLLVPTSCPEVQCCMYLDDLMLMSRSRDALTKAAREVAEALKMMGLELNATKSIYTGFGDLKHADCTNLDVHNVSVPMTYRTDLLGFDLHSEAVQCETDAQRKRGDTAFTRLSRIAKLPGGALHKQKLVSLMVASLWQWAPLGQKPHATARASLRRRVTAVLNGPKFPRSQSHEIVYGALLKGHLLDPAWIQVHATIVLAWKMLSVDLSSQVLLGVPPTPGSLLHDLDEMLRSYGMTRSGSVIQGTNTSLDFMAFESAGALAHSAREHFRTHMFAALEARRPKEFEGISLGINREWLHRYHASLKDPLRASAFRRFTSGSFLCKERQHRHSKGIINPHCMICPGAEVETMTHITTSCVRHSFAYQRQYLGSLSPESAARLARNGLPILAVDVLAAGYDAFACFMGSIVAVLLQRDIDIDNANVMLPDLDPADLAFECEPRRRLRGKQPPPKESAPLPKRRRGKISIKCAPAVGRCAGVTRRRLTCKQPRPRAYDAQPTLAFDPPVNDKMKDDDSVLPRPWENFDAEDGLWRIQGHAIKLEGEGAFATLTCTLCQRHKLRKWGHLWSLSACTGGKHQRKQRAKTCVAWHRRPQHIILDEITK
eukprot:2269283-Amphidinium_carterae.1